MSNTTMTGTTEDSIDTNPRKPWEFLVVFLTLFFFFCVFLYTIDFVPEKSPIPEQEGETAITDSRLVAQYSEVPIRIVVPRIGVDINIENPSASDLPTLNVAVNKGVVHYPGSALLGENAAMFLFGHQSYLPALKNPAYKAFNGLENLSVGDEVHVFSESAMYIYTVRSVSMKKANEAQINLEKGVRMLTLSTCHSVGAKEERYVVEADFVSRTPYSKPSIERPV